MDRNNQLNEDRHKFELDRIFRSSPWMKTSEKQRHKTKIFKSGNSLAVRIPAGTDLVAGMEMELVVEHGQFLSYEPVVQPKKKFNIAKVAGSATSLKLIEDNARMFDERSLDWPDSKA
jgi:antitoxin VapB